MGIPFKHTAGFGKRMEYNLVGKMLMEGLDVYLPLVDDHGVDCVIKKSDGTFIEVQIKARSNEVTNGDAALFAAITHDLTPNFYFVFYSERLDTMWIMSSEEFLTECVTNKNGKNKGKPYAENTLYTVFKLINKLFEFFKNDLELIEVNPSARSRAFLSDSRNC